LTDTLLSLDAGTTSVKAALFDSLGSCLGIGREEYQLSTPSAEQAELDTEVYWQASVKAIRAALLQAGVDPPGVRAIAVSSQGETTITLDAKGRPLRPALVWLDNRSAPQAERLAAQFDRQTVYETTGVPEIMPTWTACKILWIKENEPEVFAQACKFLLVKDYLIYRLCGEYTSEGAIACTSLLYDIRRGCWWPEMLEAVGISTEQLPALRQPGEIVGRLSNLAAEELGLSQQTLVIPAGMDQAAGAIGAGGVSPDVISETTGAAMAIQVTTPYPDMSSPVRIPLCVHDLPGMYLYVPNLPTGGMSFKWFRDVFGEAEMQAAAASGQDAYDLLSALAAQVAPGSDGLVMLPYLMGSFSPEENPAARGVFSGFTLRHTRGHFVRAILEGVAFNLRHNMEVLGTAGLHFSELRSSGGGARSMLWNKIKADVCGLPLVTLANAEAALLGDAILGGGACGQYGSVAEACSRMVAIERRIYPGEARQDYEKTYRRYIELNACLGPYFRANYIG
jgi:sugar (pentulose or hexulose) kinase